MKALPLVYVLGDSISIQYGPYLEKYLAGSWRYSRKQGEAEALLNLDQPMGANGGDSSRVLEFYRGIVQTEGFRPDLMLINCGAHDIKADPVTKKTQIPLPAYRENLQAIVRISAERGLPMAWVQSSHQSDEIHNVRFAGAFHRYNKDRIAYDEAAQQVMAEGNVPFIPFGDFTRQLGTDDELFCDHAHFHETYREKQAVFLAGWLAAWKTAHSL